MKKLKCLGLLAGVVCAVSTAPANADVIYAAQGGNVPGSLYTLNQTTGAATLVGALLNASGAAYALTGLAFHPTTGVLYGSTSNASPTARGSLVTVNPATGLVTPVGAFANIASTCADITFNAAGTLYCWEAAGSHRLHTVNITTGAVTVVPGAPSTLAFGGGGLAFDLGGTLYSAFDGATASPSNLYTLNPANGAPTDVGNLTGSTVGDAFGHLGAMDVGSNNLLYALDSDQRGSANEVLVTVAKAGGALTTIGSTGVNRLDALAIQRVAVVPVPATLALLGIGLVGLGWIRRRK